jgi:glycerophosphoryl diester phosphodiesterase
LAAAILASALLAATAPAGSAPANVTIVAHRGLAEGVPENTIAAFRQSLARGVAIIELDLRVTKDGKLVVIHDEMLDRTTDCIGLVAAMDLEKVLACDAGGGQRVPSFAEVLALVRSKPVRVLADVKNGTPLSPVLDEVRAHGAARQIILGLRSTKHVARARDALPDATILAYMSHVEDAQDFAEAGSHVIRLWSDWVEADPDVIARTRALGPEVWIMVGRRLPEKEREWRALHAQMIAAGAQGLITDRPDLTSAR